MPDTGRRIRLGLQAKVLGVVTVFLLIVPSFALWTVNRGMARQMESEASRTLESAQSQFAKSLEDRSRNILERYERLVDVVSFQTIGGAVVDPLKPAEDRQGARNTIVNLLDDQLDNAPEDDSLLLYYPAGAGPDETLTARRVAELDVDAFKEASSRITQFALDGTPDAGVVGVNGKAYIVISVPVMSSSIGTQVGALTAGITLTDSTILNLILPGTQMIIYVGDEIAFSSPELRQRSVGNLASTAEAPSPVIIGGVHYMAQTSGLAFDQGRARQPGVSYVMLSSYEDRLRELQNTRRTLMEIGISGVLVGAAVVGLFIRRATRPIQDLRDSAEAVGRGDFSRRIKRFSNDELGELAQEFNRMTERIETSRAELEKAVQSLKVTQTQLIQSEKLSAVGQFVAGVAHELNNPLTSVIGFSDLLSQTQNDPKVRRHVELIAKSAHRCHKIVQSLLSFARQHPPERRLVEINRLVDEVLEIMAYDLRTSNIKVEREFNADLPKVIADPHQLQQVFVNLLSNARQAIQPVRNRGKILIRTSVRAGMVEVEFTDDGPGIPETHLPRVFDPFFTTKPVGKGTGLGLSLCYGIIQEHGGQISVQSTPGEGATFRIVLPIPPADSESADAASAHPWSAARPPDGSGRTVLLADDEEWILELGSDLLRGDGYKVDVVTSGEAALEALRRQKYDVVVTDWKMPGVSGIALFEQLSVEKPELAERLIFMTGDVINENFEEFLRRHGRTCLRKPFSIDEFRAAVANVVEPPRT